MGHNVIITSTVNSSNIMTTKQRILLLLFTENSNMTENKTYETLFWATTQDIYTLLMTYRHLIQTKVFFNIHRHPVYINLIHHLYLSKPPGGSDLSTWSRVVTFITKAVCLSKSEKIRLRCFSNLLLKAIEKTTFWPFNVQVQTDFHFLQLIIFWQALIFALIETNSL